MTAVLLHLDVRGDAKPQGSKVKLRYGMKESAEGLPAWREAVRHAAAKHLNDIGQPPYLGAVRLVVTFTKKRPKSHYGTGRNANVLKESAPEDCTGRNHGDVDKLCRAVMDALTMAGLWRDDSQVTHMEAARVWCEPGQPPGVAIEVEALQ